MDPTPAAVVAFRVVAAGQLGRQLGEQAGKAPALPKLRPAGLRPRDCGRPSRM